MTRKLKLNLDDLSVESFRTEGGGSRPTGTVRGHYYQYPELENQWGFDSVVAAYGCGTDGPVTSDVYTPMGCTDTGTSEVYTPVGCTAYTECQVSCGGTCNSCNETICCV